MGRSSILRNAFIPSRFKSASEAGPGCGWAWTIRSQAPKVANMPPVTVKKSRRSNSLPGMLEASLVRDFRPHRGRSMRASSPPQTEACDASTGCAQEHTGTGSESQASNEFSSNFVRVFNTHNFRWTPGVPARESPPSGDVMGSCEAPWSACGSSHRLSFVRVPYESRAEGGGCCHTHSKVLRTSPCQNAR